MPKEEKLFISLYLDFYGALLTARQNEFLRLYYDRDLSLQEISEQYGISRQAVRDTLVRAERQLLDYEQKIGGISRIAGIVTKLKEIADESADQNTRGRLLALAARLEEE